MMADNRKRNFATIVYQESAPDDWMSILSDLHVPAFVSPLHDRDTKDDGTLKKPHWHVILMFEGKKSPDDVRLYCEKFGGVGLEVISSLRGHVRYLCHLDDPDKFIYPVEDVRCFCGADFYVYSNLPSKKYDYIGEMIDFCLEKKCYSYCSLLLYAKKNKREWCQCLCDNGTFVMKEFVKSLYWQIREGDSIEDIQNF